jgi:hypothetical protein
VGTVEIIGMVRRVTADRASTSWWRPVISTSRSARRAAAEEDRGCNRDESRCERAPKATNGERSVYLCHNYCELDAPWYQSAYNGWIPETRYNFPSSASFDCLTAHSANGPDALLPRLDQCATQRGLMPNMVAVDDAQGSPVVELLGGESGDLRDLADGREPEETTAPTTIVSAIPSGSITTLVDAAAEDVVQAGRTATETEQLDGATLELRLHATLLQHVEQGDLDTAAPTLGPATGDPFALTDLGDVPPEVGRASGFECTNSGTGCG